MIYANAPLQRSGLQKPPLEARRPLSSLLKAAVKLPLNLLSVYPALKPP